jgi:hypothetical protein
VDPGFSKVFAKRGVNIETHVNSISYSDSGGAEKHG